MTPQVLFASAHAGTPEPADDMGEVFDLAAYLVTNPLDTFYVRVAGDSMIDSGIFDGDILVVDRTAEPQPPNVVVVDVGDGNYTVRQFKRELGRLRLVSSSPTGQSLDFTRDTRVCGVARFAIHRL